jgi:hypothetical protein
MVADSSFQVNRDHNHDTPIQPCSDTGVEVDLQSTLSALGITMERLPQWDEHGNHWPERYVLKTKGFITRGSSDMSEVDTDEDYEGTDESTDEIAMEIADESTNEGAPKGKGTDESTDESTGEETPAE